MRETGDTVLESAEMEEKMVHNVENTVQKAEDIIHHVEETIQQVKDNVL